jgi:hypothetical protein
MFPPLRESRCYVEWLNGRSRTRSEIQTQCPDKSKQHWRLRCRLVALNLRVGNAELNTGTGARNGVATLTANLRITPERPCGWPVGMVS